VAASVVTVRARTSDDGGSRSVGSGVVTSSDRVVTAAHNLNGASDFVVVANNGRQYTAKVIGTDPTTDLALLSVSDGDFQLARLGASATTRVGQAVVAVSAGPHYRVNINVVSDRDVMVDAGTGVDVAGLLETGIPITPDMSGGALVDPSGDLVGILTRAAGGTPDGLAIPVSVVRDVQDQLEASGKVEHGWIGVVCDKDPAESPAQGGAVVRVVVADSPAADAGLQPDDVIVRAAGRIITGRPDLVAAIRSLRPQDPLEVQYVRDGRTHPKVVTVKAGDPAALAFPGMG
jgi:serine protease Do